MRFIADCCHSRAGCLSGACRLTDFIDNWTSFWGRPDLLKRDSLHPSWGGATLFSKNVAHSLRLRTCLTGAQVRKPTDWLNRPSASRLLPPQYYGYKNEPRPKGKGGGVATIYSNTLSISQKTGFKYNSFELMVLHITLSREKSINDKSPVMFLLATVYRPPGHHTYFLKIIC